MTTRPGNFLNKFYGGANALITPAGQQLNVGDHSGAILMYGLVTYTATATAGNRAVTFRLIDGNGNIIFQNVAAAITANQVSRLVLAAGLPNASFTSPLMQIIGLPNEMLLQPLSTLTLLDSANVDVNDSFSANFGLAT